MGYALKMPEMQKNRPQIFRFEVCMWCARRDSVRMTECDLPPRRRRGFVGFGHSSFSPGKSPLSRGPHYPVSRRVAPDIKKTATPMGSPFCWCARRDLNPHARSEH